MNAYNLRSVATMMCSENSVGFQDGFTRYISAYMVYNTTMTKSHRKKEKRNFIDKITSGAAHRCFYS